MFEVKKVIKINASAASVFTALTSSNKIIKYYPLKEVISDWALGSKVEYKGEVNGDAFTDFGVIEKFEPSTVYSYRYWSDNHGTERTKENHLVVSYFLSELEDGLELTLTQSNIPSQALYDLMNNQVWDYLLGSLKDYAEINT
jgi:uncharacterized protein YndB with AHSA1/START domain